MSALPAHHPLSGRTCKLVSRSRALQGQDFKVKDWWHQVSVESWKNSSDPVALEYKVRLISDSLPLDDAVVFGTMGTVNVLVHDLEIERPDR